MEYLNFGWIIEGLLAGAQGPTSRRDLVYLNLQTIRSIVRMEEQTISGESIDLVDLFEPVADGTPPSLEQIERMVLFIQEEIRMWEHPVVVTCYAGFGRNRHGPGLLYGLRRLYSGQSRLPYTRATPRARLKLGNKRMRYTNTPRC